MKIKQGKKSYSTYDKIAINIEKILNLTRKSFIIFFVYMCIKTIILTKQI